MVCYGIFWSGQLYSFAVACVAGVEIGWGRGGGGERERGGVSAREEKNPSLFYPSFISSTENWYLLHIAFLFLYIIVTIIFYYYYYITLCMFYMITKLTIKSYLQLISLKKIFGPSTIYNIPFD